MNNAPEQLYIPLDTLKQWHKRYPCLPAYEPVCVGDPHTTYVRKDIADAAYRQGCADSAVLCRAGPNIPDRSKLVQDHWLEMSNEIAALPDNKPEGE